MELEYEDEKEDFSVKFRCPKGHIDFDGATFSAYCIECGDQGVAKEYAWSEVEILEDPYKLQTL